MHHIIYMSRAAAPMSDEQLARLLEQAREGNKKRSITGALVYGAGQFMQIIEGEESQLAQLYAELLNDSRHGSVVKLADKQVAQRSFSDWSMAFQTLSPDQFEQLLGYTAPDKLQLQAPGLSEADALLLEMMKAFVLSPRA